MKKKIYAAPCAETVLFVATDAIASSNWKWTWKWGVQQFQNNEVISAQGINPIWEDYAKQDNTFGDKPY